MKIQSVFLGSTLLLAFPFLASAATFTLPLNVGSSGKEVTALQRGLASKGYFTAAPTGYYGTLTQAAVRQFQTANGIAPLGNVGPATRAALNAAELGAEVLGTSTSATSAAIPLAFNDPMFSSAANSDSVSLVSGGSLANKSITVDGPSASIACQGACTIDHVRVNSSEAVRVGGAGTVTISNSYLEATGSGDDHADVIQAYSPGSRGTINISNTSIVAHNTAATAGMFIADNWTGNINLSNVVFNGGPFGLRVHPDIGGDNIITAKDVYFVGPFGYDPILMSDGDGHKNIVTQWDNVRNATIVNGVLVPGALIPCPTSSCGTTTSPTEPAPAPTPAPTSTPSTPAVIDTKRPTKPTGLHATASSSSQISLTWSASTDNIGVTGYQVFRNGAQVGTSTGTAYSDTGLSAATLYKYQVRATDAAGNLSYKSTTAKAMTLRGN